MSALHIQPGWFSIPGAARYTGFSISAIRTAIDGGKLPKRVVAVKEGSSKPSIRIKREDLDTWIIGDTTAPAR